MAPTDRPPTRRASGYDARMGSGRSLSSAPDSADALKARPGEGGTSDAKPRSQPDLPGQARRDLAAGRRVQGAALAGGAAANTSALQRPGSGGSRSYAGLLYAANTVRSGAGSKFYGDIQEKLTAITTQPAFLRAWSSTGSTKTVSRGGASVSAGLAYYRPWVEDLRKEKPYQLDDRDRAAVPRKVGHRAAAPGTGCSTRP